MDLPQRTNLRLREYDYSLNGAYFVTICVKDRASLFGRVVVGADLVSARAELNPAGRIVEEVLHETIQAFAGVHLDRYVIMPNHFHGIFVISRADTRSAPTVPVTSVVQAFKSKTTVAYIKAVKAGLLLPFDKQIWQRNYYEHVIRNEKAYLRVCQYIDENPARWEEDEYYSA